MRATEVQSGASETRARGGDMKLGIHILPVTADAPGSTRARSSCRTS
jgi:hypothetical protein